MRPPRLTEMAREAVSGVLHRGDRAIDATVGNGHDTLLLARLVVPDGHVIGFDVQPGALDGAGARLRAAGLEQAVTLIGCGHESMAERVPADWAGRVGAVMFNLGYLPGGDKSLTTAATTTIAALQQAVRLLRAGGLISLLVYRGHPGSTDEADAVAAWIEQRGGHLEVTRHDSPGPVLYLIRRRG